MEIMKTKKTTLVKKKTQSNTTPGRKKKEDKNVLPSTMNIKKYTTQRDKKGDINISQKTEQEEQDNDIMKDNNKEDDIRIPEDNTIHDKSQEDTLPLRKKTTFGPINTPPPIKKKIDRFQNFQNGDKCVVGSGRCATHHIKLVKRVVERKVSKLNKFGQVTWTMGEGIIFDCPKSGQTERSGDSTAPINLPVKGNSTNKKIRLINKNELDQPEVL